MAVLRANPHILCKDLCYRDQVIANSGYPSSSSFGHFSFPSLGNGKRECRKRRWRSKVSPHPFWPEISRPSSIEMEAVTGTEQFDEILRLTKENAQPIIVDWMAAWCRKCIHLKPKLEKLASEYHQRVKFYYVDVNKVPQSLVKTGNITKMPTIQLWKDGEMKEEVIGGHKAWMVVDEVREMIEKHM